MKITSGIYKYRKIEVPERIRPTTEKVREAILSMSAPRIDGAVVMDMFAGSGALGIEALSRGAVYCYFIESSRAVYKILQSNIAECGAEGKSTIYNADYMVAISELGKLGITPEVVFMDPPYEMCDYYEKAMQALQDNKIADEGCLVIAEHLYDNKLLDNYGFFRRIKEKKYGSIGVDVYIYESTTE